MASIPINRTALIRFGLALGLLLLAGCASTPNKPAAPAAGHPAVVSYALSLKGTPYRWGKASPTEGFDCSGFVQHVYGKHGVHLPRTTREIAQALPSVDKSERRPGDLLFFNTSGKPFSHVGIYVGQDTFVHAPSSHTGRVIVSSLDRHYWWRRLISVRRPGVGDRFLSGR